MIFEKPDVFIKSYTKDEKQVYILDRWGVTKHDKVAIKMQSGKKLLFIIKDVEKVHEARVDDKKIQGKTSDGRFVSVATIEPDKYI